MQVYSFFLKITKQEESNYTFLDEYNLPLTDEYNGVHPIIKTSDGYYHILYGMTTNKSLAKLFRITRDMNKFALYKSDIDKDQYEKMARVLEDMLLQIYELFDNDYDAKGNKITIPLVLANHEISKVEDYTDFIMSICSDTVYSDNDPDYSDNPPILPLKSFSPKLAYYLKLIGYEVIYEMCYSMQGANDSDSFSSEEVYYYIDSMRDGMKMKTFSLFVKLYGNTLKEEDEVI